jgi:hypothetical protein
MKKTIFWDIVLCSISGVCPGQMYGLHVQGQTINQERNKQQTELVSLGLFF